MDVSVSLRQHRAPKGVARWASLSSPVRPCANRVGGCDSPSVALPWHAGRSRPWRANMTIGLRSGRLVARAAAVAGLAALVSAGFTVASPAPAEAAGTPVYIQGHGWGHGRGMGQYGAYGYAVNYSKPYSWILDHFYGGTHKAIAAGTTMTVELTRLTGGDTIVHGNGLTINGIGVGAAAVLIHRTGPGTFQPRAAAGCGGPWVNWGVPLASGLTIATTGDQSNPANLVVACLSLIHI